MVGPRSIALPLRPFEETNIPGRQGIFLVPPAPPRPSQRAVSPSEGAFFISPPNLPPLTPPKPAEAPPVGVTGQPSGAVGTCIDFIPDHGIFVERDDQITITAQAPFSNATVYILIYGIDVCGNEVFDSRVLELSKGDSPIFLTFRLNFDGWLVGIWVTVSASPNVD